MLKLHPAHLLFVLIITVGIAAPDDFEHALDTLNDWFSTSFGWLILLLCAFFVVFCTYLAFSRYGRLRLGGPDERPQYGTVSWLAMLFAAGMGSGLVFYGAAEPLMHYTQPPPSAETITTDAELARRSMAMTFFHWGIHAWAIYAIAALGIAYFTFHRHTPMLPSAPIKGYLPQKWQEPVGFLVNTVSILAVVFGLVASIAQAVLQLSEGILKQYPLELAQQEVMLLVLAIMFLCYMASSLTDISKGIRILSNINIAIAVALMLFVLIVGPTLFIMETTVSGIGDYLSGFVHLSLDTRQYTDHDGWTRGWTITYFLWWIAWGPFVGIFIARISRGRTIKQFVLGVILLPTIFSAMWFATLGGTAIHMDMIDQPGFGEQVKNAHSAIFLMLSYLPLEQITSIVVLLLLFIFLVTSADSGTYVLGMFTSNGNLNPPVTQRLFWGIMVALVTVGAIMSGRDTEYFRAFAVVGSIPYVFIMLWQCWGLWKALHRDIDSQDSAKHQ